MRFKKAIMSGFVWGMLSLPGMTHADIWGVEDAELIRQAIAQIKLLKEQKDTLESTLNNAKSQLQKAEDLKNLNKGSYGFGNLKNSASDLKNRQWSSDSWDGALKNIAGGNPARYKQLVTAYEKNHKTINDDEFLKGASKAKLNSHKQNKAVNKTASIETTYAYDEVNKHIKTVYELSSQIEKAQNTKSAVDLNSRLVAEVAYLQAQNLKIQTLISQQMVQRGASDIEDDARQARFNQLPDGFK